MPKLGELNFADPSPNKKKYDKKKERQKKYDLHDTRRRNNTQGED